MKLHNDHRARLTPVEPIHMASDRLSDQDNGHANKIIYSRLSRSWWALAHKIERGLLEQIALPSYAPPVPAAPLRGPDDRCSIAG